MPTPTSPASKSSLHVLASTEWVDKDTGELLQRVPAFLSEKHEHNALEARFQENLWDNTPSALLQVAYMGGGGGGQGGQNNDTHIHGAHFSPLSLSNLHLSVLVSPRIAEGASVTQSSVPTRRPGLP